MNSKKQPLFAVAHTILARKLDMDIQTISDTS